MRDETNDTLLAKPVLIATACIMDELILRELWGNLVLVDFISSHQKREIIYQDYPGRNLLIYIYCEPNHKGLTYTYIWKKDYEASISIEECEILAGAI